jgi:hypothetical protein
MLLLRRVHIRRFRSVAPDTTLDLGAGFVFLLGRNGSGKTTLLDLLARLVSCDLAPFLEEEEIPGRFILCEATGGDEGRLWCWRNPTPDEARRLRCAWDAGFQQLSEVLLSEGLW